MHLGEDRTKARQADETDLLDAKSPFVTANCAFPRLANRTTRKTILAICPPTDPISHEPLLGAHIEVCHGMGELMDHLEVISARTSMEDELELLTFARRNRHVRIISSDAGLDGPIYLSISDIASLRTRGTAGDRTILLWNSKIPNPLCWSLFLYRYDKSWKPIDPQFGTHIEYQHTADGELQLCDSFRRHPITRDLFRFGMFDRVLSPVLEVSLAKEGLNGFSITADFSGFPGGVWLAWNGSEDRWEHESRDLRQLYSSEFVQPPEFVAWQRQLFDWIRKNWPDKIMPSYTYRILESGDTLYYRSTDL